MATRRQLPRFAAFPRHAPQVATIAEHNRRFAQRGLLRQQRRLFRALTTLPSTTSIINPATTQGVRAFFSPVFPSEFGFRSFICIF